MIAETANPLHEVDGFLAAIRVRVKRAARYRTLDTQLIRLVVAKIMHFGRPT